MINRSFLRVSTALAAAACVVAVPNLAAAQAVPADLTTMPPVPTTYQPKKTSWGDPDLRGTWPIDNIASLPMNRPASFGNRFWLNDEEYAAPMRAALTLILQTCLTFARSKA